MNLLFVRTMSPRKLFDQLLWGGRANPDYEFCEEIYQNSVLPLDEEGKLPVWSWEVLLDDSYEIRCSRANNIKSFFPDTKVLITIRHPFSWAESAYMQEIKRNNLRDEYRNVSPYFITIDEWFKERATSDSKPPRSFLDYERSIETYAQIFGRDSVKVCLFEQLVESSSAFITEICDFFEIDSAEGVELTSDKHENSRWNIEQVEKIHSIKQSKRRSVAYQKAKLPKRHTMLGLLPGGEIPPSKEKFRPQISDEWKSWMSRLNSRWQSSLN